MIAGTLIRCTPGDNPIRNAIKSRYFVPFAFSEFSFQSIASMTIAANKNVLNPKTFDSTPLNQNVSQKAKARAATAAERYVIREPKKSPSDGFIKFSISFTVTI